MTPAKLRALADELDAEGLRLLDAGKRDDARIAFTKAEARREMARQMEAGGESPLPSLREQTSVNREMLTAEHKTAISAGRSSDPLAKAAQAAGLTMRSLADRVGISAALLSMARKGQRSIKRDVAERIEALTGFKASKAHWPKLS